MGRGLDRRRELGRIDSQAAEEDRGEQEKQRQLDHLALGVGHQGDQDPNAGRGQHQQAEGQGDGPGIAQERHLEQSQQGAQGDRRDGRPEEAEGDVLADQQLAAADRRDPEQVDEAAPAVALHGQGAQGDPDVLDDQGEHGQAVERQDRRLCRGQVDRLGSGGRRQHLGASGRG